MEKLFPLKKTETNGITAKTKNTRSHNPLSKASLPPSRKLKLSENLKMQML